MIPGLSRVAVFGTSTFPGTAQNLKETELAAGALRIQLQYLDVLDPKDIETAFRDASKGRAEAVLFAGGLLYSILSERGLSSLRQSIRLTGIHGIENLWKPEG